MGSKSGKSNILPAAVSGVADALFSKVQQRVAAGQLTVTRIGNQKHYQANALAPVFEELRGLVLKTSGLVDILRSALAPLAGQIHLAFVLAPLQRPRTP
jgi:hypothetical protein